MRYDETNVGDKVEWHKPFGVVKKGEITRKECGECRIEWEDGTAGWYMVALAEMRVLGRAKEDQRDKIFNAMEVGYVVKWNRSGGDVWLGEVKDKHGPPLKEVRIRWENGQESWYHNYLVEMEVVATEEYDKKKQYQFFAKPQDGHCPCGILYVAKRCVYHPRP